MNNIFKVMLIGAITLILASCSYLQGISKLELSQEDLIREIARAEATYIVLTDTLIDLRRPCVEIGPDAPNCVITDELYGPIDKVLDTIEAGLDNANAFIGIDEDLANSQLQVVLQQIFDLQQTAAEFENQIGGN